MTRNHLRMRCRIITWSALAIAILWGCAAYAADNVEAFGQAIQHLPQQVTTKGDDITLCKEASSIGKLELFSAQGDEAAFLQFMLDRLFDGSCVHLEGMQTVFVEKSDPDNKAVCVRPEHDTSDCLWASASELEWSSAAPAGK